MSNAEILSNYEVVILHQQSEDGSILVESCFLLPLYGFMLLYGCWEGFFLEVGKIRVQGLNLKTLLSQSACSRFYH